MDSVFTLFHTILPSLIGQPHALMQWFADGAMTLLGYEVERPGAEGTGGLGIFRFPGEPTDEGGCEGAIRYFEKGGRVPLMAKGDRKSSIHRRVPLDLVAVPLCFASWNPL